MSLGAAASLISQIDQLQRDIIRTVRTRRPLPPTDRPSDLVQQALVDAMVHAPQFRGSTIDELKAWIRRILHNNHLRLIRRRHHSDGRQREVSLDSVPINARCLEINADPAERASTNERNRILGNSLLSLSEQARRIVLLRHSEGLTFAEIAVDVHSTEEAVRKVHSRSIRRIRETLEDSDF